MWYVTGCWRVFSSLLKQQHSGGSGSSSPARLGTRTYYRTPSQHHPDRPAVRPPPRPPPPPPPPPEPLSTISAASARKAPRADSVRTAAVWSRGAGAGAAASSRPVKWQERQIPVIFGKLWFIRTPQPSTLGPPFSRIQGERRKASLLRGLAPVHSDARQYGAMHSLLSPPLLKFCKLQAAAWEETLCTYSSRTAP